MRPMSEEMLQDREDTVAAHRETAERHLARHPGQGKTWVTPGCGCDTPWCQYMEQGNDEIFRLRRENARLQRHLKFRDRDSALMHGQIDRLERKIKDLGLDPYSEPPAEERRKP